MAYKMPRVGILYFPHEFPHETHWMTSCFPVSVGASIGWASSNSTALRAAPAGDVGIVTDHARAEMANEGLNHAQGNAQALPCG